MVLKYLLRLSKEFEVNSLKKISLFVERSLNEERKFNKDLDLLIKDFKKI